MSASELSFEEQNPLPGVMPITEGIWQEPVVEEPGFLARAKEHVSRRKWRYLGGLAAVSAALTFTNNPYEDLKDDVFEAAPYVAGGVAVSEVAFCVGAAMMVGAVVDKIGNPLKLKEKMPEIAKKANGSNLFKAGFVVNTIGAVGDFAVISTGVIDKMPIESYGVLALTLGDLAITVAIRKGILNAIEDNDTDQSSLVPEISTE